MPSILMGTASGGYPVLSGFFASGVIAPVGGVQFFNDKASSGSVYLAFGPWLLSGGITIKSGGATFSGSMTDGMQVPPALGYFLPMTAMQNSYGQLTGGPYSGQPNVWAATDAASGFARLFFQVL